MLAETLKPLPAARLRVLESPALTSRSVSYVYRPSTIDGIRQVMKEAGESGHSVGVRGAGSGLENAALNAENVSIELTRMNRILTWDPDEGRIEVEPGVTVGALWRHVIEDGWWPAVVPSSMTATLGGSASVDAYGKNHWTQGSMGDHVESIDLLLANGTCLHCSATENEEVFRAARGGLGLIGIIAGLRLRMRPVSSGLLRVRRLKSRNLSDTFAMLEAWSRRAEYLTGWIDGSASGPALGRGIVLTAQHVEDGQSAHPTLRQDFQELPPLVGGLVPRSELWRVLGLASRAGTRFVNEAVYRVVKNRPGDERLMALTRFLFPQDYVPGWQRALSRAGVVLYQPFLPEATSRPAFHRLLKETRTAGLLPCLVTINRHRRSSTLLSRSLDGYSLSMHFALTMANERSIFRLLDRLTEDVVLPAGGRVLPLGDGAGSEDKATRAFGADGVGRFLELKRVHDRGELLQSDLYRRMFPRL